MTKSIIELCWDNHRQTGTLGYPNTRPIVLGEAHCSMAVCDRPECRASANRAVRKVTGHDGVYVSYTQARAEGAVFMAELNRKRMEAKAAELAAFYYPDDPGPRQLALEVEA